MSEEWWKSAPVAQDDGDWWKSAPVADGAPAPSRAAPTRSPMTPSSDPQLETRGPGPTGVISQELYDTGAIARRPTGLDIAMSRPRATPAPPDPFEGEGFGDLAARRGQQVAAGATEAVAAVPEGLAIAAANIERAGDRRAQALLERGGNNEALSQIVASIQERLADPTISPDERAFREQQLADYGIGAEVRSARARDRLATPLVPAQDRALFQAGDRIREASQEIFGKPDPRDQGFWSKFAYGAGNVTGMAATSGVAALATGGAGALAVGGAQGAAMNASQIYKEALEAGADEETAMDAASAAGLVGASEIFPIARALRMVGGPRVTNTFMRRFIDIGQSAGEEAAQEFAAQVANNMIAQGYYDPERGTFQGAGEAAAVGALLGGGLGAAGTLLDRSPVNVGETPPDASAALKETPAAQPPGAQPVRPAQTTDVAPDQAAALGAAQPQEPASTIAQRVRQGMTRPAPAAATEAPSAAPPASQPVAEPAPPAGDSAAVPAADATPAAEAQPEAGAPTPEGNTPAQEPTPVPEAPETIEAQREALRAGRKKAVLYPFGSVTPVEIPGSRFKRIMVPGVGVLDYDSRVINAKEILALNKFGKLNEVLELGPYNKQEVAESANAGFPPIGIVERTPEGVEVKAAAGTQETAPEQIAALEATKASPDNVVAPELPASVIAGRVASSRTAPTQDPGRSIKDQFTPEQLAEMAASAPAPKVTPEGKRVFTVASNAEVQRRIEEFNQRLGQQAKAVNETVTDEDNFAVARPSNAESALERAADVRQQANDGVFSDPKAEVEARKREGDKKGKRFWDQQIENARAADAVRINWLPKNVDEAGSMSDLAFVEDRFRKTIEDAKKRQVSMGTEVSDSTPNAVAWLMQVRTTLRKLENLKATQPGSNARSQILSEIIRFLEAEREYADTGGTRSLREIRKEEGTAVGAVVASPDDFGDSLEDENQLSPEEQLIARQEQEATDREARTTILGPDDEGPRENRASLAAPPDEPAAADEPTIRGFEERSAPVERRQKRVISKPAVRPADRKPTPPREGKLTLKGNAAPRVGAKGIQVLGKTAIPDGGMKDVTPTGDGEALPLRKASANPTQRAESKAVRQTTAGALLEKLEQPTLVELIRQRAPDAAALPVRVQTTMVSRLAKALRALVSDVPVFVVRRSDFDKLDDGRAIEAMGLYLDGKIYIPSDVYGDPELVTHAVLHEAAHAAMVGAVRNNPEIAGAVEQLRTIVETEVAQMPAEQVPDLLYGLSNIDEFLAEAWSNPDFQIALSQIVIPQSIITSMKIPAPSGTVANALAAIRMLLSRVMDVPKILSLLGFPPRSRTAFDVAMQLSGALMETQPGTATAPVVAMAARKAKATPGGKRPESIRSRMVKRGLNARQAAEVDKVIREEFDGQATDEQLDEIAALIKADVDAGETLAKQAKDQAKRIDDMGKGVSEDALKEAEKDFVPGKNPGRPWLLNFLTNGQLGRVADRFYGKDNNPVRTIAELIERRRVKKSEYETEMGEVVQDLVEARRKFKAKEMEAFFDLANDATMANVHPDVPLDHKRNAHLGKKALSGVHGKAMHAELAARYQALPDGLKDLYNRTRDTLTDAQNLMTYKLMKNILGKLGVSDDAVVRRFHEDNATEADYKLIGEEAAAHLKKATELKKIKGPYFNLARRGNFVVVGRYELTPPGNARVLEPNVFEFKTRNEAIAYSQRIATSQKLRGDIQSVWVDKNTGETYAVDADGEEVRISKNDVDAENRFRVTVQNEHVEFVDSRREALRIKKNLEKDGLKVRDIEPKQWERQAQNAQMLSDQYRALMATLEKRGSTKKLTPTQKRELVGLLNEVSLRFLGSTRIQSSRLPRRNVKGASRDLVANTAEYVTKTSGYLSRLDTEPDLEKALETLETRHKEVSSGGVGAGEGSRMVADAIKKRALEPDYGANDGPWARSVERIKRAVFVNFLGSIGYSIVNTLQVPTMTLGTLSGEFNPASASYHLVKAYYDVSAVRLAGSGLVDTAKAVVGKKVTGDHFLGDIKGRLKEKREKDMMQELADVGLIDVAGGLEITQDIQRASPVVHYTIDAPLNYLENVVRALPQAVEAINRSVTALAAYRLMYAKTKNHKKAVQYAKDAVDETQGNYSASNAPPVFNSMAGRLLLQFKKYGQMVYATLGRNVYRAARGGGPGERRKGILTLAYTAAAMQVVAGSIGLPYLEIPRLMFIGASTLLGADLSWEDFEEEVEKFWTSMTGSETGGQMLTYGVTRGIPGGWGFDLSERVGMSDLLTRGEPRSDRDADEKAFIFDLVAGPMGGMAFNMANGMNDLFKGDISEGMSKLLPFKTATDAIKSARGVEAGTMTPQDAVLRVLGLTSARQAQINTERGRDIREVSDNRQEYSELIRDYTQATSDAERAHVWQRAQTYNRGLPEDGRRITLNVLKNARQRELERYRN